MELTYTMKDGYRLPDLLPPQEPETALGKYGLLRRRYLKESTGRCCSRTC